MNNINHLIISSTIDFSTDLVCIGLEKSNQKYLRINRDQLSEYNIVFSVNNELMKIEIDDVDYWICPDDLKSIYFRAPVFLRSPAKEISLDKQLERSQWSAFYRNLILFDKAYWINNPVSTYQAENKMYQLKVAKSIGLDIPQTYVGNSLPDFISHEKTYMVKSLDTALFQDKTEELFTYSNAVLGSELLNSEIKLAPIMLQEFLSRKIDIRVTIVGNNIFAASITRMGKEIYGDWRVTKKEMLTYSPIELPEEVMTKLLALMKSLNLSFGGIDLALVKDRYYFIEVNPTGEWGWLAGNPGFPIDQAIVDIMITGEKDA